MALDAIGETERARQLFTWVQFLRHEDGAYWCGMNFDGDVFDRPGEHFTADQPTCRISMVWGMPPSVSRVTTAWRSEWT